MSNETNNIDELFRGKLRDYSVEAPEHVWKGIEASRTPLHRALNYFKGKKGGVALGSFILLATVSSIAYFMGTDSATLSQQNTTAYSIQRYNTTASTSAVKLNDAIAVQASNSYNTNESVATTASIGKEKTTTPNFTGSKTTLPHNNATDATGNSTLPATNNNSIGGTTDNSDTKLSTSEQNTTDTKQVTGTQTQENNSATATETAEQPAVAKEDNPKDEVIVATDATNPPKNTETDEANKGAAQGGGTTEPAKNYSKFTADVYAGGNYTMHSLSNNGADQNYFAAKRDAESYKPGIVLGLRINYDVKDFLKLRVGAQYTRFSQQINLEREYKYTTIETRTGVILDPITQQPIGTDIFTDTVEHTEIAKANATNTISFIDIPVQLEFNVYKTKNYSVFATAGAAMNLRFTQKGYQLNNRLNGLDEISSNNTPFKTTAGISILAGAGINYNLTNRYSVLAEVNYQHGINNVMNATAGMNQSYRIISGSVGLRYRF